MDEIQTYWCEKERWDKTDVLYVWQHNTPEKLNELLSKYNIIFRCVKTVHNSTVW